jgi:hypothetical protein
MNDASAFPFVWHFRTRLPERKGEVCRVLARGRMNSILVQFPDGHRVITSRYAVRPLTSPVAARGFSERR